MRKTRPCCYFGSLILINAVVGKRIGSSQQKEQKQERRSFLLFHPIDAGQGQGNIISGLLAAHLLGAEYGRTVCVSIEYTTFHQAFQALNQDQEEECQRIEQSTPRNNEEHWIRAFNYDKRGVNECQISDRLTMANTTQVLHFMGNTYPGGWPSRTSIFKNNSILFQQHYRPTQALIDILPWSMLLSPKSQNSPKVVVHLRQPDGPKDNARQGLDEDTFHGLGQQLPSDTFLVTNRLTWYDWFHTHYGWSHPSWSNLTHSALGIDWGTSPTTTTTNQDDEHHRRVKNEKDDHGDKVALQKSMSSSQQQKTINNLQLWSDWYTILNAETVYHTYSEFSISAIRWNFNANKQASSFTIRGSETLGNGTIILNLTLDRDRNGDERRSLVDRPRSALNHCDLKDDTQAALMRKFKWIVVLCIALLGLLGCFFKTVLSSTRQMIIMPSVVEVSMRKTRTTTLSSTEHAQSKVD